MADAMDRNFFLADFAKAARLARPQFDSKRIDFKECVDHEIGTLPKGRSYVYAFWMPDGDRYLKIGKAGPNSQPRIYQHYSVDNARSTLARSIQDTPGSIGLLTAPKDPAKWIRENTRLFLFIMPDGDRFSRNFLEAYLHLRFNPVYEKG